MRRNVLLVTADQWRGDCLSSLGHPLALTPNIDAFAAEGVTFARHYSVCAPCGPSRASLLTGMYLHNHRSVRNGTPLEDRHTNLAREARRAGYRPRLYGYTDTTLDPRAHALEDVLRHGYENLMPGFEEGLLLPGEQPTAWLADLAAKGYPVRDVDEAFAPASPSPADRGRTFAPARYAVADGPTAFLTDRLLRDLAESGPGWFVHLSWLRPHPPFIAPAPWHERYHPASVPSPVRAHSVAEEAALHPYLAALLGSGDTAGMLHGAVPGSDRYEVEMRQLRATYYALVSEVDHEFGRLLSFLRGTGMLDDTLVILTSDHGELLGDHYLFGKRGFHDAAFHVPLLVRDPALPRAGRGRVVSSFSESVDVMPTICQWLDIDIPAQCDGRSLLGVMRGEDSGRDAVHWSYDVGNDGEAVHRLLGGTRPPTFDVVRTAHAKYVHGSGMPSLLFDLDADPGERRNRLRDPALAGLRAELLDRLLQRRIDSMPRALADLVVSRDGITELAPGAGLR